MRSNINLYNMKRIYNLTLTIPEEKLDIALFRLDDETTHKCNSSGCIIGWATQLDKIENIPRNEDGGIDFVNWSIQFTGIETVNIQWKFCFSSGWQYNIRNDKEQMLLRLQYFIDNNGLVPNNFYDESNYYKNFILHGDYKKEPYELNN